MGASNSINREPTDSPPNPDPMSDSPSKTQSKEPQSDPTPSSPHPPAAAEQVETGGGAEEDDEEEKGECGFCLFMKGGGCKESFEAWENCIEEAEKTNEDIVQKCFEMTSKLKDCMLAHSDYYEPILRAEKAAEEQAIKELDSEKSTDKEEEAVIELNDNVETPPAAEGGVSSEGEGSSSRLD
ncbi:uncharacterized protein LOC126802634 [Argentina anserina]|uniref:uncharacterized protein LOC126802634 n=1 Tax=Argentina anserina TaxID=57926 RepID=UPI0021768FBF|nr:uncharacterized protein LOC126802634 [Potentilla anserina]